MTYLPIIGLLIGLIILVVLMAGPGERRVEMIQKIGMTLVVLIVMSLLFALVTRDFLTP
ncbi:MAG: hypothetical protein M3238_04755 [Actinomycetota bacterium]|nr:hypothetical protein [Actinomycetota bacterium]